MVAFLIVAFAIGAVLAAAASVPQFAVGLLVLELVGLAQAIRVGVPVGEALLGAAGLFGCAQIGYVAGIGVRAWIELKISRSEERKENRRATTRAEFDLPGSSALNEGHDPVGH